MLLRKRLGRRHQRALVTGLDCPQERIQRHHGLARADVALEEALHRPWLREIAPELAHRSLLLRCQHEGQELAVAGDQLTVLTEGRRHGSLLRLGTPAAQPELEDEELAEGETTTGSLGLGARARLMGGTDRVPERRKLLRRDERGRQRIPKETRQPKRAVGDLTQAPRRELLARRVDGHQPDRVQAAPRLGPFVPLDLERGGPVPRALEAPVQEQTRARPKLVSEVCLVEPDRRDARAGLVSHLPLDDLEVAPPGRAHAHAVDRAGDRGFLTGHHGGEAGRLLPVEEVAWDVLDDVANRPEPGAEPPEPLRDLRPDARQRLHRRLGFDPPTHPNRALVHTSKAGQRRARAHMEGQDASESRPRFGRRASSPRYRGPYGWPSQ